MGTDKRDEGTDQRIQCMFDAYIRIVFKHRVMNALKRFTRQQRKKMIWQDEAIEDICDIQQIPCFEKNEVNLDVVMIYVDDDRLAAALRSLTSKQKAVIGYSFVLELSAEEIAKILGIEIHGVYEHKCRAMKNLRIKMGKEKIYDSG